MKKSATAQRAQAWVTAWALGIFSLSAIASTEGLAKSEQAPEFRLRAEIVTLPFVMVREYPFVEGSVEGVRGKWMLDTGLEIALAINDHRVPLDTTSTGDGQFGSGQKFAIRRAPVVRQVHVGGLDFPQVTTVQTQDATQLERITPDFLGWIGFNLWNPSTLKMDYRQQKATFYRSASADALAGEELVAALPFGLRKLPHIPVMAGRVGDLPVAAAFDTGAYGMLCIDQQSMDRLLASGVLKPSGKDGRYDLSGLRIGATAMPDLKEIFVLTSGFPAAVPTGLTDPAVLVLGYAFLRQFKTVWDYREQKLYLLRP
ncbi:hypothetical protein [Pseudoduganella rhizocola]|uniref:hypothetical protein n=1 Tax=Pseudoduganella rhizocola TaxID=3382643 RepID=UPI0038B42DFC